VTGQNPCKQQTGIVTEKAPQKMSGLQEPLEALTFSVVELGGIESTTSRMPLSVTEHGEYNKPSSTAFIISICNVAQLEFFIHSQSIGRAAFLANLDDRRHSEELQKKLPPLQSHP